MLVSEYKSAYWYFLIHWSQYEEYPLPAWLIYTMATCRNQQRVEVNGKVSGQPLMSTEYGLKFHLLFFSPFKITAFFSKYQWSSTYFVFLITINSKPYQSVGLYCVVPQCLICLCNLQHFPWQPRSAAQTRSWVLLLDHSLSAGWRSCWFPADD